MRDDESFELKTKPTPVNNNLSIWMKQGETKDSAWVIGELIAELPFDKIQEVLSNTEKHTLYDKMLDKYSVLKELVPGYTILHRINKTGFMNPAWDYVISTAKNNLTSGEIVFSFFTTESADMPEQEKVTRS